MAVMTLTDTYNNTGYAFSIDPDSITWSYSMNIKQFPTYGGRVVQMLACQVDSLTVQGYILPKKPLRTNKRDMTRKSREYVPTKNLEEYPSGYRFRKVEQASTVYDFPEMGTMGRNAKIGVLPWQGMREFEYNVKKIMKIHEGYNEAGKGGRPVRLDVPILDMAFDVWLTGYTDVRYQNDTPAIRYTLSFDIDYGGIGEGWSGFAKIKNAASANGLDKIPDGVNWVRNEYNTPTTDWADVKSAMEKLVDDAGTHDASNPADFYEYLAEVLGSGSDEEKTDGESDTEEASEKDEKFVDKAKKAGNGKIVKGVVSYLSKVVPKSTDTSKK